ncbi:MAG TPA: Uma2 family endonuclease [Blastocatellia bacterium]|nr:Uma2 family endonuclease [Blastocatellia bacterium]
MARNPKMPVTPEQYLALERDAEQRSEYLDGEMVAMTGASRRHNLIVTNLVGELRQQLKGKPCEVYASDMRVKVLASGLYTYPDVVVVCGEPRFEDEHVDTLLNPTLIIEVLSESTESYDRGKKFGYYRTINSVTEYLLIAQDKLRVERYVKQGDDRWLYSEAASLDETIELSSVECALALKEVYDKVSLP